MRRCCCSALATAKPPKAPAARLPVHAPRPKKRALGDSGSGNECVRRRRRRRRCRVARATPVTLGGPSLRKSMHWPIQSLGLDSLPGASSSPVHRTSRAHAQARSCRRRRLCPGPQCHVRSGPSAPQLEHPLLSLFSPPLSPLPPLTLHPPCSRPHLPHDSRSFYLGSQQLTVGQCAKFCLTLTQTESCWRKAFLDRVFLMRL